MSPEKKPTNITSIIKQSEKSFQQQIVTLAKLKGWAVYHTFDSRRSQAGFPDLVLCRPPRLIFAEIKTERGKTKDLQLAWLNILHQCGPITYVWRPQNWEQIKEILE